MKKGFFVLLLITAFAAPVFAQGECPTDSIGDQKVKKTVVAENQVKKATNKHKGIDPGC